MPTQNPRLSFMLSEEQLTRLEAFQHERKIKSTSKAIVQLLTVGMDELEKEARPDNVQPPKPPPPPVPRDLTEEMENLLQTLTPKQASLLVTLAKKTLKYAESKPTIR
ncbi:MAG: hypothetical protein J6X53_03675 [Abditibacteriota bacterium]|nr:hypothetical protein [Abditibacteriota bacterium]